MWTIIKALFAFAALDGIVAVAGYHVLGGTERIVQRINAATTLRQEQIDCISDLRCDYDEFLRQAGMESSQRP